MTLPLELRRSDRVVSFSLLDQVLAPSHQTSFRNTEGRVGIGFGENLLDLLSVQFGNVVSEFRGLEVPHHDGTQLGTNCSQTPTQVFIGLVVGGNVEGRSVTIIEVVEVGMNVGHAIYHKTWELHGCSLHCSLSIVKQSKVRGSNGSILFVL